MPRPDETVLRHFRYIVEQRSASIAFESYTPSYSYQYYRECIRMDCYIRPLATAVCISLRTKKYRTELIEVIDCLLKYLPERQKHQKALLERTFYPLPENSQQPVRIVKFRDIQVFDESEVLQLLKEKSTALWRAVCFRIGLTTMLEEMQE